MRTFIAIDTGPEVANMVESISDKLKRMGFKASWVPRENAHLTLAFLNEVDEKKISLLGSMILNRMRGFPSFSVKVSKFGYFRNKSLPKAFWIGFEENKHLQDLFEETKKVLESFNISIEGKFYPHITIGRMKFSPKYWEKLIQTINVEKVIIPVKELTIYESILKKEGAIYKKRYICDFEGGLKEYD
jgi:2'-5' RNA ligase